MRSLPISATHRFRSHNTARIAKDLGHAKLYQAHIWYGTETDSAWKARGQGRQGSEIESDACSWNSLNIGLWKEELKVKEIGNAAIFLG